MTTPVDPASVGLWPGHRIWFRRSIVRRQMARSIRAPRTVSNAHLSSNSRRLAERRLAGRVKRARRVSPVKRPGPLSHHGLRLPGLQRVGSKDLLQCWTAWPRLVAHLVARKLGIDRAARSSVVFQIEAPPTVAQRPAQRIGRAGIKSMRSAKAREFFFFRSSRGDLGPPVRQLPMRNCIDGSGSKRLR